MTQYFFEGKKCFNINPKRMRRLCGVLILAFLYVGCYTPEQTETGNTATQRFFSQRKTRENSDTIYIIATQNMIVTGRNEAGVSADLEGRWVLYSIDSIPISDSSAVHLGSIKKLAAEKRIDSLVTSRVINGDTIIEIMTERPSVSRITPPQSSNYHIPEKPSLSFFGSNETFTGFTGCNKIAGRFKIVYPDVISFQNAAPSTRMACIGDYDETAFIKALHRIKTFKTDGRRLKMFEGGKEVMVFVRQ